MLVCTNCINIKYELCKIINYIKRVLIHFINIISNSGALIKKKVMKVKVDNKIFVYYK